MLATVKNYYGSHVKKNFWIRLVYKIISNITWTILLTPPLADTASVNLCTLWVSFIISGHSSSSFGMFLCPKICTLNSASKDCSQASKAACPAETDSNTFLGVYTVLDDPQAMDWCVQKYEGLVLYLWVRQFWGMIYLSEFPCRTRLKLPCVGICLKSSFFLPSSLSLPWSPLCLTGFSWNHLFNQLFEHKPSS